MKKEINFTVSGIAFNGTIYTNPFMFGRAERVDIFDNRTHRYVMKTIKIDDNDRLFFTWNGKTVFVKEMIDHFECEVE